MDKKNFNKSFFENKTPVNNSPKSSFSISKLLIVLFIILIILIIIYVVICLVKYNNINCYKKKSFSNYLFDFNNSNVCLLDKAPYTPPPKKDAPIIPKPTPLKETTSELSKLLGKKEVFHIGNQDYTYKQSQCKCSSYGSRLATTNEVKQAYNNGANWCTYGWTEGQNAFYPVQKCYYQSLKEKNASNENNNDDFLENSDKYCGKPGLNGGFFANPELKFGANCYGVKPKGSVVKLKNPDICPEKSFCEQKNNFQASHALETDEIAAFNNDSWNMT